MKMLGFALISLLVACAPIEMVPVEQLAPVVVRAEMQRSQVEAGEAGLLVVTVDAFEGWGAELAVPEVDGLAIESVPMQVSDGLGRRTSTFEFHLSGDGGSYVIPSFEVVVASDDETVVTETSVMFFDIGEPRFSSELSGLSGPPPRPDSPWPRWFLLATIALVAIGVILLFIKWLSRRASLPVPLPPEDEEALLAWRAICKDMALSDHERALALSRIFRRYIERRFLFGASAMTTSEVLSNCGVVGVSGDIEDVGRLLSATDLIKFAGRQGGERLFTELGSALVGFVESNGNLASKEASEPEVEAADV